MKTLGRKSSEVSHRGELGIAVGAGHRGKGVGSALLRSTLERCKGKLEIVEPTVFSKNEAAKRLYGRSGFEKYGARPSSVKRGNVYLEEDLVRLEL
ncbi:MAG: GNAT family N-acetyltransferase [Nitrososphaerota archaeon]|nr:GNAT family N-acetyltransferase [Nitrososphaerota archaeon]